MRSRGSCPGVKPTVYLMGEYPYLSPVIPTGISGQQVFDDLARYVRKAIVTAGVAVGELLVSEAEDMEQGA